MLRRILILMIAMIAIVASKRLPHGRVNEYFVIGSPALIPGSGSCRSSRSDCNICGCYRNRVQCTNINCNNLPVAVKTSNAVADISLPSWPGTSGTAVGQVYRWHACGFCVRTADSSHYCVASC